MKVCFISDIYPVLRPKSGGSFGGAEVQQYKIAKALLNKRSDVKIIFTVRDYRQADTVYIGGMKLIKTYRPNSGIRGIRVYYPWSYKLWKAMLQADADIYYQRCAEFTTGITALFCKLHAKKFVFAIANDRDVNFEYEKNHNRRDTWLYRYGLKNAASIIAQSDYQKKLLKKNYGCNSLIIKSIRNLSSPNKRPRLGEGVVLWVGSFDRVKKRPHLFLKLAREIPDKRFLMIGRKGEDKTYYKKLIKNVHSVKNLTLIENIPFDKMDRIYKKASILVSTSAHEGFPNVFLEAWSYGIPVVTLDVDPDEVVCKKRLGVHSRNFQKIIKDINYLYRQERFYLGLSENCIEYVKRNHSAEVTGKEYDTLFSHLLHITPATNA